MKCKIITGNDYGDVEKRFNVFMSEHREEAVVQFSTNAVSQDLRRDVLITQYTYSITYYP